MPTESSYATGFLPMLQGLRAIAAWGILLTHVAFQVGIDPATTPGAILARCDFFVAVFFALSAYLLWRRHQDDLSCGHYYLSRALRILPAYLCVCLTVLLLSKASLAQAVSTLTLTQIYLPNGLLPGISQLWSLCVEVAFYLVLPLFLALPSHWRLPAVALVTCAGLGWPWLGAQIATDSVNPQLFPLAWAPWFAVGILCAELEPWLRPRSFFTSALWRPLGWLFAVALMWIAGQDWFGPLGLTHPTAAEFNRRILAGALFALVILLPHVLGPPSRVLCSEVFQACGQYSYGFFLWHVAVLAILFPILGIHYFSESWKDFGIILVACTVVSFIVAAASFILVEQPVQRWGKKLR